MDATVLNQQQTVGDVITCLDAYHVVAVVGPPGSGKSQTAASLVEQWRTRVGVAAVATGDEYQKARRYFPFQQAITQFNVERDFLTKAASGALAKTAGSIPIAGPLAGYVVEKMFARSQAITKERYSFLNSEEQNILYQLQHITGKKRLLLICDDLQSWDDSSRSLLRLLLSKAISHGYTFLKEARFVLIETIRDHIHETRLHEVTGDAISVPKWSFHYVSRAEFPTVLRLFGLSRDLPDDLLDAIYSVCGGHLHITQQLVQYLQREEASLSKRWLNEDENQFVLRLIEARLKALGLIGTELMSLLHAASAIGHIFSDYELACLVDRDLQDVRNLLTKGEALRLVRREPRFVHFAHGILLESLKRARPYHSETLHSQFAACLKKLRPGDYRSRAQHLRMTADLEEASALAACSQLRDQRSGVVISNEEELQTIRDSGMYETVETLKKAYELAQGYDLNEAERLLSRIDPVSPTILLAEAGYIKAMCLIKRYRYDSRDEAIKIIRRWLERITDEGELTTRLLSTELVALAHQRRQDEALAAEAYLIENLRRRMAFDADSRDALIILDRKADLLYAADQAHHRLLRAKEYFSPDPGGQPRDFYQYCAATLNLAANCIMCANYFEALGYLHELVAFLERNPGHQFSRFEVLASNLIVAELRSDVYGPSTAASHFDALLMRVLSTMDYVLELSNCGACWALAGNLQRACDILAPVLRNLEAAPEADEYHRYFAGTNLGSSLYLSGQTTQAIAIFDSLEASVETVNPSHASYFRNRHRILRQAMQENRRLSPQEWDLLPLRVDPTGTGPGWQHYGHGFLLSDIQIWTES